jgi:hypothetical protein
VNNTYDAERLKTDASSQGINESLINYLSRDPYIKISYDLLSAMAK